MLRARFDKFDKAKNASKYTEFCFGEYEVVIDDGPRIRLPRPIVKGLHEHRVRQLWRFADPTGPRMILCPDCFRNIYIETASQNLPKSMPAEDAYLKYICTGMKMECALPNQNKIRITAICQKHINVKPGQRLVIIGTGFWFTTLRLDDWLRIANTT